MTAPVDTATESADKPARPLTTVALARSRVRWRDLPSVATVGPRTRRVRSLLTAIGIAIGIAALVAVLGIAQSAKADLIAQLDALGTNRLQVQAGQSTTGNEAQLPERADDQIRRIPAVRNVAATTGVDATVRRSDRIPEGQTGGIVPRAGDIGLLDTIGGTVADGRWHDNASIHLPTVVLGSKAAERLGIDHVDGRTVLIGDQWFTVIGILDPIPLYETLDSAVFVGYPIAAERFNTPANPGTVYVTTDPDSIDAVRDVIGATANPLHPNEVKVSNPTDALAARRAVSSTLTALLLGLGGVALLVGGIGIANVMVIGVLERRTEIGVRRALGATRGHIRTQFLLEAIVLGALGGLLGVGLGVAVTTAYTTARHTALAMPANALVGGFAAAVVIGAVAGLSPAARAARLAPADAIRPA